MQEALQAWQHSKRWLIGYSGGLDSSVLLHQLAAMPERPPLHAVHINHQLSSHADAWQSHARQCCDHLQVPITVIKVNVREGQGKGLEDAARAARYEAFEALIEAGDVLMLAHHRDDQTETMLLRLLRGAGVRGLAGMPAHRAIGQGNLLRPLLNQSKAELELYAETHGLTYVVDESNNDLMLDRNYLRQNVMPALEARWPGFTRNWAHSAEVLAEASQTLDHIAETDAHACGLRQESYGCSLQLPALRSLSLLRAFGVLRYACEQYAVPSLPRYSFTAIMQELIEARPDGQPKISWKGGQARRFDERTYLLHELPALGIADSTVWQRSGPEVDTFDARLGESLTLNVAWLLPPPMNRSVRVCFRQGGEIIRAPGRNSKSLKQWFQEQRIAPWMRERTPLLFVDEELIAVGETCVSQSTEWQVKNICLTLAAH